MLDLKAIFDLDEPSSKSLDQRGSSVVSLQCIIGPEDLSPEWRMEWEERAAIMEFHGKLPRERAEHLALVDVVERMKRADVSQPMAR